MKKYKKQPLLRKKTVAMSNSEKNKRLSHRFFSVAAVVYGVLL